MKKILFNTGVLLFMLLVATSAIVSDINSTRALPPPPLPGPPARTEFDSIKTDLKDYMWPTDASTKITSSFAEYRSTHFHGGIDISTNGQTGYKVFAVRDGYVYRIRIMANGYGKMLYIKHRDGYYSTYAHLLTFSDDINSLARKEQYRLGTYAIDLTLDPSVAPVKKGDVVAFTGDSGFGPPHLHFELRDENLNPINPLLCENFMVGDNIPPSIRRVMVTPLNASSWIDNSLRPKILSRFPGRKSHVRIPQTLRAHGLIGPVLDLVGTHIGIFPVFEEARALVLADELDECRSIGLPVCRKAFEVFEDGLEPGRPEQVHGILGVLVEVGVEDALVHEPRVVVEEGPLQEVDLQGREDFGQPVPDRTHPLLSGWCEASETVAPPSLEPTFASTTVRDKFTVEYTSTNTFLQNDLGRTVGSAGRPAYRDLLVLKVGNRHVFCGKLLAIETVLQDIVKSALQVLHPWGNHTLHLGRVFHHARPHGLP